MVFKIHEIWLKVPVKDGYFWIQSFHIHWGPIYDRQTIKYEHEENPSSCLSNFQENDFFFIWTLTMHAITVQKAESMQFHLGGRYSEATEI
jgi:hypothetical protein